MLRLAAYLNFLIALAHLVCLFWADDMFRLTGITEHMNKWAEIHPTIPYLITIVVAFIFFIFGLYALSAAGGFRKLPLLQVAVFAIAGIYLLRGVGGFIANILAGDNMLQFVYSSVAFIIGLLYLLGGLKKWYPR